jgi:glycosyltransferase involved in cell wall biosynthesis
MSSVAPALSVVVPVHNEAANVAPLVTEIHEVMAAVGRPFEVIFVNDGSTDATLEQLRRSAAGAPGLRIIDLDGNFGEAAALCAGFRAARGALVVTLDGDGQNDPHDIPRLLDALARRGADAVSGWRQARQESRLRVWPSRLANRLIAAVTGVPLHDNGCGLKVYRRAVVQHPALPRGMNRFMPAILGVTADVVGEIPVRDRRRPHGHSHYGIGRTLAVLRDLPAVRVIIANPDGGAGRWAVAMVASLAVGVYGRWAHRLWLSVPSAVVLVLAATVWWNVRRFQRARRAGVYRVRQEYSSAEAVQRLPADGGGELQACEI